MEDQHFPLLFPPFRTSNTLRYLKIFISHFSVQWYGVASALCIGFTLESKEKLFLMQNDKKPPLLSTTAVRPASQRKHQPVPRTAALERVEPTYELTRQSRS